MDARRWRAAGRPSNASKPHLVEADRVIARTVHRLSLWGFPLRSVRGRRPGACHVVGKVAFEILHRHDGGFPRRPLGPDQVEKLYKAWRVREGAQLGRSPLQRAGFTKHSLALTRPAVFPLKRDDLEGYARMLLTAGGEWRPAGVGHVILEMLREPSPKARARKTG